MAKIIEETTFRDKIHVFNDRLHAGELLAKRLTAYAGKKDVYVLAIPAGGVQVGIDVTPTVIDCSTASSQGAVPAE